MKMNMKERENKKMATGKKDTSMRVVVDVRDETKDYFLPYARACKLFKEKKLSQMSVYNNTWDFYDPTGKYKSEAVK